MHSVFIAGSRALSKLNPQVKERLENIVRKNLTVLIGDANGADKAVQKYLANLNYRNVVVYSMEECRNNLGEWPVRKCTAAPGVKRDRFYYGIKDAAMVRDSTCGFMLWDGESKGTLTDAVGLLKAEKKVVLYLSAQKQFFTLGKIKDLDNALNRVGIKDVDRFLASKGNAAAIGYYAS